MKYFYYPGCSLEGSAREYEISARSLLNALGCELEEIEDWTCCGAGAAESISHLLSLALPARNIAIAERQQEQKDILVPCSACYLNLKKVEVKTKRDPHLREELNTVLKEAGLKLTGKAKVRHILDIISVDIGPEHIDRMVVDRMAKKFANSSQIGESQTRKNKSRESQTGESQTIENLTGESQTRVEQNIEDRSNCIDVGRKMKKRFEGFRFAPYYGCQCLRPYPVFDDPESPHSMDALIEATGAEIYQWSMGAKCCGASHINTDPDVSINLVKAILMSAKGVSAPKADPEEMSSGETRTRGADAIITVCPMCQMNLEAYQKKASSICNEDLSIPVIYLTQLLGLAIGLPDKDIRLDLNLSEALKLKAA